MESPRSSEAPKSTTDNKRRLGDEEASSEQQKLGTQASKRKRLEERHQKLRKRGRTPPSVYSRRDRSRSPNNDTTTTRDRKRSLSPIAPRRSPTPEAQSRPRKRPGGGARMGIADRETLRRRQEDRERAQEVEAQQALRDRGVADVVRQHYNAVPQRGREWRKTESKIKGLRSFNNWVKSCLIQKFSPSEEFLSSHNGGRDWADGSGPPPPEEKRLLVVDLGCGKGGDLGKWQQAPQPVDLYVGLDPAEISIDQARDRYNAMRSGRGGSRGRPRQPLFHAEFWPKDCFGEWLGDVRIVQEVGIDGNVGPGGSLMSSRWGGGGFDVVASMFTMHYAFESEEKTRQMLRNVAGCLKKGGRFLGVGPNSDVITARVAEFHEKRKAREAAKRAAAEAPEDGEVEEEDKRPEWGNDIYRVRFPGETPEDGIFRPPFGWKYSYFMQEAVEEVPEYVVPWEAFRALTEDYNLELQYRKPFLEIWKEEMNDPELGPLSERMGVRDRSTGALLMTDEEKEAANFYHAFCFYKLVLLSSHREVYTHLSLQRIMSATPGSSRRPRTHHHHREGSSRAPPMAPEYERPIAPLNAAGQRALSMHLQAHSLSRLKKHIQHAEEKLTDSAGEINERLTDARYRYRKEEQRRRENEVELNILGSEEEGNDEDANQQSLQRIAAMEQQVTSTSEKLEEQMRQIVDAEVKLESLSSIVHELGAEAETTAIQLQQARRRQRTRRQREDEDGDEDGEREEESDENYEGTPEREARDNARRNPPSQQLVDKLAAQSARWESLSLTERYTTNNAYIGFYRIVHESKHPSDEIPPVPNASTWFAHVEESVPTSNARRTRRNQQETDSDDDSEIAIEREKTSLTCPLTLRTYVDPVSSSKCPHSFERSAIQDMINASSSTISVSASAATSAGSRRRVRAVKCPVCTVMLAEADLRPDPVLLRRVRRAEEAMQREAEEAEFDPEGARRRRRPKGGRVSGYTLASDDVDPHDDGSDGGSDGSGGDVEVIAEMDTDDEQTHLTQTQRQVRIKSERAVSRSFSAAPSEIVDMDDMDVDTGTDEDEEE
ncbi:hypothetical protein ASPZODRAFT_69562 [Penicilliopsis zonata CBS 506.65]|uniref:mRNA cap guanine-N(7) methyltransferase n=1 Tax=Penicilliopsis zonata CBS 506.65 TaxID=1073090 RepID=A0A1L9SE56_9EURO|nr:hypothetical protein ASPZODRAFT_69562 [Penicilliopsis zonata CBS 506.65]OJJ45471.1 hypothetical protein ASPZODRAFT_69562 [Penicilliopsis zonata CBS 506.65]